MAPALWDCCQDKRSCCWHRKMCKEVLALAGPFHFSYDTRSLVTLPSPNTWPLGPLGAYKLLCKH